MRWGDMKDVANAGRPPLSNQGIRPVPTDVDPKMDSDPLNGRTRRARSGSEGKSASPLSGNGGRRYAAEGVNRN